MEELRTTGPLRNLREMQSYCYKHEGQISGESHHYGYIAESKQYRYCLRCEPTQGAYNGYLYAYDKHQQELLMAEKSSEQDFEMGGIST